MDKNINIIIKTLEKNRNELRNKIYSKNLKKREFELLKIYDKMLLENYNKLSK